MNNISNYDFAIAAYVSLEARLDGGTTIKNGVRGRGHDEARKLFYCCY